MLTLQINVNDSIFGSKNLAPYDELVSLMQEQLSYSLGLQIKQIPKVLFVSQVLEYDHVYPLGS